MPDKEFTKPKVCPYLKDVCLPCSGQCNQEDYKKCPQYLAWEAMGPKKQEPYHWPW